MITYTYNDMDDLIEVCVKNMVSENFTEEQARSYMKELLPALDYWKKYDELSDNGQFEEFKKKLINEINELNVDGMPKVEKLNALVGKYVNLEYRLPNGQAAKFLNEAKTYLGNQRNTLEGIRPPIESYLLTWQIIKKKFIGRFLCFTIGCLHYYRLTNIHPGYHSA